MPVAMELSRIIISEINDQQVIYLKEVDGPHVSDSDRHIRSDEHRPPREGIQSPRPLTHDLLVSVVEALGGEFQDVVISELRSTRTSPSCACGTTANWSRSTPGPATRSRWPSPAIRRCRSTSRKKC